MDVDNFINYLHTEIFANNRDWPSNNLKKWRSSSPVTKWKWFLYDLDFGWGNEYSEFKGNIFDFTLTDSGPDWPNGPASTFLQRTLMQNEEFKSAFINRFSVLLVTYFSPGILKENMPIVEATSGNTGISFAALGSYYNHPVHIFMPNWVSKERIDIMKLYGDAFGNIVAERETKSRKDANLQKWLQKFDDSWLYAQQNYHQRWERNWKLYHNIRVKRSHDGVVKTFVPMVNLSFV